MVKSTLLMSLDVGKSRILTTSQSPCKHAKTVLESFFVLCVYRPHQGFQSGPVPGTFTRLRSCIVPAEITEPPKISGGQNHKYDGRICFIKN